MFCSAVRFSVLASALPAVPAALPARLVPVVPAAVLSFVRLELRPGLGPGPGLALVLEPGPVAALFGRLEPERAAAPESALHGRLGPEAAEAAALHVRPGPERAAAEAEAERAALPASAG